MSFKFILDSNYYNIKRKIITYLYWNNILFCEHLLWNNVTQYLV